MIFRKNRYTYSRSANSKNRVSCTDTATMKIRCRLPKCDGWALRLLASGSRNRVLPRSAPRRSRMRYHGKHVPIHFRENDRRKLLGRLRKRLSAFRTFRLGIQRNRRRMALLRSRLEPRRIPFLCRPQTHRHRRSPRKRLTSHTWSTTRKEAIFCRRGCVSVGPVSETEQFILISTECHGYREKGKYDPLLDKAVLPDYFEIDHVRVFDRI